MTVQEQLAACFDFVKKRISFQPEIALILGSGLGGFADKIDVKETLAYADIPNFEEYETRGITTSIPYWVYVALFLAWGFLMILLFLWVSKDRKGK